MHFWHTLPRPFFALAPMADVTDAAFRRMFARHGKPDVLWTEFVSCDGLWHTRERQGIPDEENPLMRDLLFSEEERPVVAQLFTARPDMMEYGARVARELGFDGVDINMGCPDRAIERQGAGAALIKDLSLAREIIAAAKEGAGPLPVSVKTRIGYAAPEVARWLGGVLEAQPHALTIHARTRHDLSRVPARWEYVQEACALRDAASLATIIIGNGDITSREEGTCRAQEAGCEGVMVGRGAFGNPWFFSPTVKKETLPLAEVLVALVAHCRLFEELLPHKPFHIMRKHFASYVRGYPRAKELRTALMACHTADEVAQVAAREAAR